MRAESPAAVLLAFALPLAGCPLEQGVAPYPRDDVAMTREDEPVAIDVLANDHGADELTRIGTRPKLGSVEARRDGTVHYTPRPEAHGEDAFSYVVTNEHGSAAARVTVHIESDDDDFGEPSVLLTGQFRFEPFAARLDRDGAPDMIVQEGDQVIALLGNGEGFREVERWGERRCCRGRAPLVVDLDLDGDTDVVRFDERGGLTIHLVEEAESDGEIAFEDHALAYDGQDEPEIEGIRLNRSIPRAAASGDFDGDGAMDLAVALDDFVPSLVLHSDVSRGRPERSRLLAETAAVAMASGDVTGDGRTDLVLLAGPALDIVTFDHDDDDVRIARVVLPGPWPESLLVAQLDDDAPEEVVLLDGTAITVLQLRRLGAELDVEWTSFESQLFGAVLADIVGDARLDLVGARRHFPAVEIWRAADADSDNTFEPSADFLLRGQASSAPAVLLYGGHVRVLAGRFNDDREEHELVVFQGPER